MSDLFSTVKNATNPTWNGGFLTHISNYYPYVQRIMEDYKKRKVYGQTNKTFLSVFRFNI